MVEFDLGMAVNVSQLRRRAERAEDALAEAIDERIAATARAERAEAAIQRVTAWLDTWSALDRRGYVTVGLVADEVRAALDSTREQT